MDRVRERIHSSRAACRLLKGTKNRWFSTAEGEQGFVELGRIVPSRSSRVSSVTTFPSPAETSVVFHLTRECSPGGAIASSDRSVKCVVALSKCDTISDFSISEVSISDASTSSSGPAGVSSATVGAAEEVGRRWFNLTDWVIAPSSSTLLRFLGLEALALSKARSLAVVMLVWDIEENLFGAYGRQFAPSHPVALFPHSSLPPDRLPTSSVSKCTRKDLERFPFLQGISNLKVCWTQSRAETSQFSSKRLGARALRHTS